MDADGGIAGINYHSLPGWFFSINSAPQKIFLEWRSDGRENMSVYPSIVGNSFRFYANGYNIENRNDTYNYIGATYYYCAFG